MKSITCLLLLLAVCASAPSLVEANRRQARRAKTSELEMDSMETPATLPVAPMFNSVSDKVAGKGRSGRRGVQKPVVPVESRKYQGDTVRGSSSAGLTDFPAISQVPVNDLCSDAITVPCGGGVALTSLVDSTTNGDSSLPTIDWNVYPWGELLAVPADPIAYYRQTGGVWFKVLGNGQRMTATTCFSLGNVVDTVLEVYEDAGDTCASGLQVVAFNDDFELNVANPVCSLYSSLASWRSEVGVWYKIHVRSWPGYQSGVPIDVNLYDGFNFKVTCAAAPQNDYCNSAEVLECPGQGTCLEVDGSNIYAGIDHLPYDGTTGSCSYNFTKTRDLQVYYNSPGVWYEVKGTGGAITVSTCGKAWKFSTLIEIYKLKTGAVDSECGVVTPFDNLECVTWLGKMALPCGSNQECDCAQSKVAWQSQVGETYKVLVKSILNRITDRNNPGNTPTSIQLLAESGGSFKLVVCNSPGEFVCDFRLE